MRGAILAALLVLLAATVFAISNTDTVRVMFWQWPVYTGPLAVAIVGAGVIGALLAYLPSLVRHAHLHRRVRDLERRLAAHEAAAPAPPVAPDTPPGVEETRPLA
ncbi:MAG TPA: LapA family protein [bacterium]|nr:LapA family protein [bacterium]